MKYTGKDIIALGIDSGPHIPAMIDRANETGICTYESMVDLLPVREPVMELQKPLDIEAVGSTNVRPIRTESDYKAVLREVSAYFDNEPEPGTEDGDRFEILLTLVEAYEAKHFPMDLLDPIGGIRLCMDQEGLTDDEAANLDSVKRSIIELSKTPVVESVAVMPDACPAGSVGTIPVGGVVASKHIHPGMHSADLCCSVMVSTYDNVTPSELMEQVYSRTHFGPGGRPEYKMSDSLRESVRSNPITRDFEDIADYHMGTQGDGNHFAFVGTLKSNGKTTLVTHHGSRGFGARVYKAGMRIAEKYRQKLSPDTLKQNAWIPRDTDDFSVYMEALDIVQEWTMENHYVIHGEESEILTWTRHNFVFERGGLIYHAKGSTPAWGGWYELEAIPLNMAEPVLLVRGNYSPYGLGFCPHGAGRNYSRSEHARRGMGDLEKETRGLDIRFWSGTPDKSELPSAYKDAETVKDQIKYFNLATVFDEVLPYGTIMAGEIRFT